MKFLGIMFLLISFCILLIAGVAALQGQTDIANSVINESSDNYDVLKQIESTTTSSMSFAGYIPLILIVLVFVAVAVMMVGAVYVVSKL